MNSLINIYNRIKEQHKDSVVFMLIGDFYETFNDDATILNKVCETIIISRMGIKIAGVPNRFMGQYVKMLVDAGYKVVIAEQKKKIDEKETM